MRSYWKTNSPKQYMSIGKKWDLSKTNTIHRSQMELELGSLHTMPNFWDWGQRITTIWLVESKHLTSWPSHKVECFFQKCLLFGNFGTKELSIHKELDQMRIETQFLVKQTFIKIFQMWLKIFKIIWAFTLWPSIGYI